jgi:hypothetical protein
MLIGAATGLMGARSRAGSTVAFSVPRGACDCQVDDAGLFNQLAVWAPEADVRKTILVENPARLFGF